MRPRFALAALTLILASALRAAGGGATALASEVDNFTDRDTLTQDGLEVLDAKVNRFIERAVQVSNQESPEHCNRVMLRRELVRWTGPDPVGIFEIWATLTDDLQRTRISFSDSIYAGAAFHDSPAMRLFGIGRTFRLAGHVIGTDKLGHFFMQGLDYFKRVQIDGAELNQVMRDENGEDGIWGLKATGVRSYGDMSANYSGYLFWEELYQGAHPYVRCEDGHRWVKSRVFTWADYVNDAWDEAINCSEMLPGLRETVKRNMEHRGLRACPIDPVRCLAISRLPKAELYVSPECLRRLD